MPKRGEEEGGADGAGGRKESRTANNAKPKSNAKAMRRLFGFGGGCFMRRSSLLCLCATGERNGAIRRRRKRFGGAVVCGRVL